MLIYKKVNFKKIILILIILIPMFLCSFINTINSESKADINNLKSSNIKKLNATIISDGFNKNIWNNGTSTMSDITIDNNGTIHVV